jgi:hypothetical protein
VDFEREKEEFKKYFYVFRQKCLKIKILSASCIYKNITHAKERKIKNKILRTFRINLFLWIKTY